MPHASPLSAGRLKRAGTHLRQRAGAVVVDNFFRGLARAGRLHPNARPERHGVEVLSNISYAASGEEHHRLDVYRPIHAQGPLPAVLYLHGGGFRILSKDTHWVMGLAYARQGYVVFNINYRLAPQHPYPAAIQDACDAYAWVVANAAAYGADPARLVVAGESAGANLAAALTVAACYPRPEPWARKVFDVGVVPRCVVPACGVLQVSDPERFARRRKMSTFIMDRLTEVSTAYLRNHRSPRPGELDLADPLVVLERGEAPARPLPPFFAPVGTWDPLLDDTRRLKQALDVLGVPCLAQYYPRELHAFHAMVFLPNARKCWAQTYKFLEQHA